MSFDTEVVREGRGVVFRLDLSADHFSSISWRFGDKGIEDLGDGVPLDARVVSFGTLNRVFAEDRSLSPATMDVVLANEDGALDALVDAWATTLKLRARFFCGLFEAGVGWPIEWKQLGEYVLSDNPRRKGGLVSVGLEEASTELGDIRTPTIGEWYAADPACPFHWLGPEDAATARLNSAWNKQLPVAWGDLPVPMTLIPGVAGGPSPDSTGHGLSTNRYHGITAWVVCATLNTDTPPSGGGTVGDIAYLWSGGLEPHPNSSVARERSGEEASAGAKANFIPRTVAVGKNNWRVWRERKSGPVTVDGRDWYILWVEIDLTAQWATTPRNAVGLNARSHIYNPNGDLSDEDITDYEDQTNRPNGEPTFRFAREMNWAAAALAGEGDVRAWALRVGSVGVTATTVRQHPVDIIEDLASLAGVATDASRLAATRATCRDREGTLLLNGGAEALGATGLSEALSSFGPSMDLDVFTTWAGKVTCVGSNETFDAAAGELPHFHEQELADMEDWLPSRQQRGAYANRIELESQTESALTGPLLEERAGGLIGAKAGLPRVLAGPFDYPDAPVTTEERIIVRNLSARWTPPSYLGRNPWWYRAVTAEARKRIRFTTGLRALTLELGDYFTLDWRRGLAAPALYEGTVFQAVGFALNPASCTVEVSALWSGDLRINRPYLLDTEAYSLRLSSPGTTLMVQDDVDQAVRGGTVVSFVTAGVVPGDILVLKDTSSWMRHRAIRITYVTASQLTLADEAPYGLDFEAAGGATVNDWVIMRGASTAHTAVSDPTHYPLGSDAYGKVAGSVGPGGTYSNDAFAHVLGD